MSTLMHAVERQRAKGHLLPPGQISLRALNAQFAPNPSGSVRALIWKMHEGVSERLPWAIILCRFRGQAADPTKETPIELFYREAFAPGGGGLVEFWRDASLGAIDVSASKVFGWYEVDIARADAGGGPPNGPGRGGLVDAAIRAAQANGVDPLQGFHSQIAVYVENWSNDDPTRPAGLPSWAPGDPLAPWYSTWIDGSADGRGKVTLTPPHDGNITAHEMGHGFGMGHDVGADLTTATDYSDPCCIMSQNNAFAHPRWNRNFGPATCLVHLTQKGWMFERRLFRAGGAWQTDPAGIELPLAPLSQPRARANLGIVLPFAKDGASWDYYLEYVIPTEWNRGLGTPFVFVRQIANTAGQSRPAILGSIPVPAALGTQADFVEPRGNVLFRVERTELAGPILRVSARKL